MSLTYSAAVEQTITAGEQIHQIVNGTATTEVTVEDGSKVPSIRKALLDNFYFKDPIVWQVGQTENVFNQLRQFTDGSWWYAPSATASNPISMGNTPVGDPLWKIYDFDAIGKLEPRVDEALRRSYAEAGYNVVGTFQEGFTYVNANDVSIDLATGKGYTGPAGVVAAGTNPASGGFVDVSNSLLSDSVTKTFEYFGAVGDGITAEDDALDLAFAWMAAGNYRGLTTQHGKIYRIVRSHVINLANGRGHSVVMKSPIRPDAGVGDAFTFQNTRNSKFHVVVDGGGDTLVDYTQADPVGAQQAFVFSGVRECDINVAGLGYRGRVLRTKKLDVSTGGVIKTSFNTININTGDRGAGQNIRCGQSYYLQSDDSAFGKIGTAFIPWDEYGSVIDKPVDITVGNIEFGADTAGGLTFKGVASAHIGTLAGGDETFSNTVLRFINADDGAECIGVDIKRIFALNGSIGVYFKGSNGAASGTRPNFTVGEIYTNNNSAVGVHLDGVNNSKFGITSRDQTVGLKLSGILRGVDISLNSANQSGAAIIADSTANLNQVTINGRAIGGGAYDGTVDLFSAATVAQIQFRDFHVSTGSGSCYKLPVANGVRINGGSINKGTGSAFSQGVAKEASGSIDGFVTRNRGGGSINVGTQTLTVTHGLAQIPTEIGINPLSTASSYRVLNIGATTFDVRLASAASGSDWTFNWFASCEFK